MRRLVLSNSPKICLIDDEDYDRLSVFKWKDTGSGIQRQTQEMYTRSSISLASEIMHQPDNMFDHKDRDYLNNRKENLRQCTQSQNMMNRAKLEGCSSIYKGVYFDKRRNKWQAKITLKGRVTSLGAYSLEIEAAEAYNKMAIQLHKEFATINIICK